jgi:TatA/E family protein of Tat protein translocase
MTPLVAFGMPAAPEWIFIGILALVLLGPKKLPELARGIGKALGELQKAKEDFHREISGVPPLPKIEAPKGLQTSGVTEPEQVAIPKDGLTSKEGVRDVSGSSASS